MKKLFTEQKWNAFAIACVFGLAIISSSIHTNSAHLSTLASVRDGIRTCFKRVSLGHTAKIIGEYSSPYLKVTFTDVTEECMGEVVSIVESELKDALPDTWTTLMGIGPEIHWFHEKLTAKNDGAFVSNGAIKVTTSNSSLGGRFQKLEEKIDIILQGIEDEISLLSSSQSTLKWPFYLLAILSPLFLFMTMRKKEGELAVIDKEIEDKALEALEENMTANIDLDGIVVDALNGAKYYNTVDLYKKMRTKGERGKDVHGKPIAIAPKSKKELEKTIDNIWNVTKDQEGEEKERRNMAKGKRSTTERQIERLSKVAPKVKQLHHLSKENISSTDVKETVRRVIDILSSKIFTGGIQVDIKVGSGVEVFAKSEELEQVFYQLLVSSIEGDHYNDLNKYVSIEAKCLGSTVLIDFRDSGVAFSEDFLRVQAGLRPRSKVEEPFELLISKSFIEGMNGTISFENTLDRKAILSGRKVQIALTRASHSKKSKLVNVQKGRKKELLKKLQQSP